MKKTAQKVCILAGACLLILSITMLVFWQWNIISCEKRAQNYVRTLRALIPEAQSAALEERRDNSMPVLSVDGISFAGILEMPRYASALPVCADWGKPSQYPCRFSGSIYNRTIKIGVTSQKGQYDFYREISVGDTVFFTDMEGNRYTLEVTDLRYVKHADRSALEREEAALVLFVKNIYDFEYLIVYCNVQQ